MTAKKREPDSENWTSEEFTMAIERPETVKSSVQTKTKDNPNKEAEAKTGLTTPENTVLKIEEDDDKVVTVISAKSEADITAAKEIAKTTPKYQDLTESLTGTPGGMTGNIQGGYLNGDGSVKDDREQSKIIAEVELKAGPNPTPNREGNEFTKAEQFLGRSLSNRIPMKISAISDELRLLKEKSSGETKEKIEQLEKDLRETVNAG
jgi:hypothetical protein